MVVLLRTAPWDEVLVELGVDLVDDSEDARELPGVSVLLDVVSGLDTASAPPPVAAGAALVPAAEVSVQAVDTNSTATTSAPSAARMIPT